MPLAGFSEKVVPAPNDPEYQLHAVVFLRRIIVCLPISP